MNLVLPAMLLTGIRLCADLMCELLIWTVSNIRWPETIGALASIVTAAIAFWALQTWKHQDKAKVKAEFLDSLIETAHAYTAEIHKPITLLEMSKIGIKANEPVRKSMGADDLLVEGAIAYINKHGENDSKRLSGVLKLIQPNVVKLRSLAAKGQVFKFDSYERCYNAVATLTWHFDRLEAFMAVIGSPTWNWDHPEVLNLLNDAIAIDPDDLRASIKKNNVELLEFARLTYEKTYG